jgi:zinc D-Ala-D-Ala carboxypeptidase
MNSRIITKESLSRKNFNWKEFFYSPTAKAKGIVNETDNINLLSSGMIVADKMQEIRDLIQKPIKINSAYRCLELNRAIGSKDTSQHPKFEACDFDSDSFGTPEQIVLFLKDSGVEVDQCLIEKSGSISWVHLSIKSKDNRNQFGKLINGKFSLI